MFINQMFQYMPRLFGVVILLFFTWLVARLGKYIVDNSFNGSESSRGTRAGTVVYVSVFVLMSPLLLGVVGVRAEWLSFAQSLISIVAQAWPLWLILGLVLGGILFITRAAPKVIADLLAARKSSLG